MKGKKTERCNVCGSDGYTDRQRYVNKGLSVNPGYTSRKICHLCYQGIDWTYLAGGRRLGIFGTIDEPYKQKRKWSDQKCVQNLVNRIAKESKRMGLDIDWPSNGTV